MENLFLAIVHILIDYKFELVPELNVLEKFTLLCDEMEEDIVSTFKFAD